MPAVSFSALRQYAGWIVAAVFALLSAFVSYHAINLRKELSLQRHATEMNAVEVRSLQQRLEAERILAQRRMESVSSSDELSQLEIAKLAASEEAGAPVLAVGVWNGVTQHGLLLTDRLPPPPEEQAYHLWVIDGSSGNPVRAAVFTTTPGSRTRVEIRPVQPVTNAVELRITSERAAGVSRPRNTLLAKGEF